MEPKKTETGAVAPVTPAKANVPVRRVGSLTLGFCLIAAGVLFLCYYFVPHFNWELALKIAPAAGLCLLGGEVLYFAAKPGKWKYDFLSVFFCLLLMVFCLCVSALPMVLDRINPENEVRETKIATEYGDTLYKTICDEAPEIQLKNFYARLRNYYGDAETVSDAAQEINSGLGTLRLNIELFGPYEQKAAFAMDCRKLTDIIQKQAIRPAIVTFYYDDVEVIDSADLHSGSMKQKYSYTLTLQGEAQLDWTSDMMTKQTEATELLDEENDSLAESEAAASEPEEEN